MGNLMAASAAPPAPSPDFTIAAAPASLSFASASSGTFTVTLTPSNGFSQAVSLTATSPTGLTIVRPSTTVSSPYPVTSFSVSSSSAGAYPVTVTATAAGLSHTTSVNVTVTAPPAPTGDFTVSVNPTGRSVKRGAATTFDITVGASGGFNSTVKLGVSGLPAGASASFSTTSITPSTHSTLTVSAGNANGKFSLTISGTSGSLTRSTTAALQIK